MISGSWHQLICSTIALESLFQAALLYWQKKKWFEEKNRGEEKVLKTVQKLYLNESCQVKDLHT